MMKKILAVVLAAAMIFSLAACSSSSKSEETTKAETKAEETEAAETEAAETPAGKTKILYRQDQGTGLRPYRYGSHQRPYPIGQQTGGGGRKDFQECHHHFGQCSENDATHNGVTLR